MVARPTTIYCVSCAKRKREARTKRLPNITNQDLTFVKFLIRLERNYLGKTAQNENTELQMQKTHLGELRSEF
jgi:hypothetical protein